MLSRFPDPIDPDRIDIRLRPDADHVPAEVLDAYGLAGADVSRLKTGSFNIHFKVESDQGTFDLRRSNRPVDRSNLLYEAELLAHLRANNFNLAPELVNTVAGESNVWTAETGWTLFRWISGGEPGVESRVTDDRIEDAARTLAAFHFATVDFAPYAKRGDIPIFALAEDWNYRWAKRSLDLADLLGPEGRDLREMALQAATEIESVDLSALARICCHADYRLRNLRFSGNRVSAVLDLDTSIISTRLLDLGCAVTRFSPLGADPQADVIAGSRFLHAYNSSSPLTEYEWQVLPIFIRWRLIRDVTIYYDQWWLKVREVCTKLFSGAADEIAHLARCQTAD